MYYGGRYNSGAIIGSFVGPPVNIYSLFTIWYAFMTNKRFLNLESWILNITIVLFVYPSDIYSTASTKSKGNWCLSKLNKNHTNILLNIYSSVLRVVYTDTSYDVNHGKEHLVGGAVINIVPNLPQNICYQTASEELSPGGGKTTVKTALYCIRKHTWWNWWNQCSIFKMLVLRCLPILQSHQRQIHQVRRWQKCHNFFVK